MNDRRPVVNDDEVVVLVVPDYQGLADVERIAGILAGDDDTPVCCLFPMFLCGLALFIFKPMSPGEQSVDNGTKRVLTVFNCSQICRSTLKTRPFKNCLMSSGVDIFQGCTLILMGWNVGGPDKAIDYAEPSPYQWGCWCWSQCPTNA